MGKRKSRKRPNNDHRKLTIEQYESHKHQRYTKKCTITFDHIEITNI